MLRAPGRQLHTANRQHGNITIRLVEKARVNELRDRVLGLRTLVFQIRRALPLRPQADDLRTERSDGAQAAVQLLHAGHQTVLRGLARLPIALRQRIDAFCQGDSAVHHRALLGGVTRIAQQRGERRLHRGQLAAEIVPAADRPEHRLQDGQRIRGRLRRGVLRYLTEKLRLQASIGCPQDDAGFDSEFLARHGQALLGGTLHRVLRRGRVGNVLRNHAQAQADVGQPA